MSKYYASFYTSTRSCQETETQSLQLTKGPGNHQSLRKGSCKELLDLLLVNRLAASRDGARGFAARVERVLALVVHCLVRRGLDAGADVCPGAVVEGLLLAPQKVGVGVLVEVGRELFGVTSVSKPVLSRQGEEATHLIVRERRDLFQARDDNVVVALLVTLRKESLVDLTYTVA